MSNDLILDRLASAKRLPQGESASPNGEAFAREYALLLQAHTSQMPNKSDLEYLGERIRVDLEKIEERAKEALEQQEERFKSDLEKIEERAKEALEQQEERFKSDLEKVEGRTRDDLEQQEGRFKSDLVNADDRIEGKLRVLEAKMEHIVLRMMVYLGGGLTTAIGLVLAAMPHWK